MDSFNPTTKTQAALTAALQAASAAGNPEIRPAHLLMALLTQNDGIAAPLLEAVGVEPATIRAETQRLLDQLPSASGASTQPQLSRESLAAITAAQQLATEMDDEYVSTEHLMVGLAGGSRSAGSTPAGDSDVAKLLTGHGASPQALREAFVKVRGCARVTSPDPEGSYQALEKYSTDLTARAREGKLDPVIGRDTEIRRVIQVLSRRTKNNPVLIGEPGVGKTAIVEGLAQRIIAGDVPGEPARQDRDQPRPGLDGGRQRSTAASSRSGSRPCSTRSRTRRARSSPSSTSCTPSSAPARPARASMDAGNMIKPMLARGELRLVGATTLDEYRKHIEKDAALERRFQQVFVGEPSVEDTVGILRGLKDRYEVHHGVRITDSALVAAATLSDRYITSRFLPDKAIDLVDEAASRLRMEIDSRPVEVDEVERLVRRLEIEEMALAKEEDEASKERLEKLRAELADQKEKLAELTTRWQNEKSAIDVVRELKEQLESLRGEADRAERDGDLAKAAELRYGRIPEVEKKLDAAVPQAEAREDVMLKEEVGPDDIADVVSAWTGIPAGRMLEGETAKLLRMEDELGKPGRRAEEGRAGGVRRGAAQPGRRRRPEPADRLVHVPRPDRRRQDRAGQGAGGVPVRRRARDGAHRHERVRREALGGPARRRPSRVRRLRPGRPADRGGAPPALHGGAVRRGREGPPRRVRRAAGCARRGPADRRPGPYGRLPQHHPDPDVQPGRPAASEEQVMAAVRAAFKPEFINRLDDVIVFDGLNADELVSIVDIQLAQLQKRLAQRRLQLEVSLHAKKWLAERGFDPLYGARPLRRLIQQAIGDQLAKMLLAGEVHDGDLVPVNVSPDGESAGPGLSPGEQTQSARHARRVGHFCVCSRYNANRCG